MTDEHYPPALTAAEIEGFIRDGFVRIDRAFPRELAEEARAIMWCDIPCAPDDPKTWTRPVIRLPGYGGGPFAAGANTPILHAAFDQLVGIGRWAPRDGLGSFPVRFPHPGDPGDAGWHVDLSFPGENCDPNEQQDFSAWRVNITSRGRALLMLFLFSDVGEEDAPTRIRVGSHMDMARYLAPAGEAGRWRMISKPWGLIVRWHWRRGRRAQSISAIPFSCMRRRNIAALRRVSWRSHRLASPGPTGWSERTATIRRSRWRSGGHCTIQPADG